MGQLSLTIDDAVELFKHETGLNLAIGTKTDYSDGNGTHGFAELSHDGNFYGILAVSQNGRGARIGESYAYKGKHPSLATDGTGRDCIGLEVAVIDGQLVRLDSNQTPFLGRAPLTEAEQRAQNATDLAYFNTGASYTPAGLMIHNEMLMHRYFCNTMSVDDAVAEAWKPLDANTSLRLLSIEKKGRRGQDRSNQWVCEKNPVTQQADPPHLDITAFSGNDFSYFFTENNDIVDACVLLGVDPGAAYRAFAEQGMRVAQKTPGKVRERHEEKYNALRDALQERIVQRARQLGLAKRNEEYSTLGKILFQSKLMYGEVDRARLALRFLRELPIADYEKEPLRPGTTLDQVKWYLDTHNEHLLGVLPEIQPAQDRFLFLQLAKYRSILTGRDSRHEPLYRFERDILGVSQLLDPHDVRTYFMLLKTMLREEGNVVLTGIERVRHDIEQASPDQRRAYFEAVREVIADPLHEAALEKGRAALNPK